MRCKPQFARMSRWKRLLRSPLAWSAVLLAVTGTLALRMWAAEAVAAHNCGHLSAIGLPAWRGDPSCSCHLWRPGDDPARGCSGEPVPCDDTRFPACPFASGLGCHLEVVGTGQRPAPGKLPAGIYTHADLAGTIHDLCCAVHYAENPALRGVAANGCHGPPALEEPCQEHSDCSCHTPDCRSAGCTQIGRWWQRYCFQQPYESSMWSEGFPLQKASDPDYPCFQEWEHAWEMNDQPFFLAHWEVMVDSSCRWQIADVQRFRDLCTLAPSLRAPDGTYLGEQDWLLGDRQPPRVAAESGEEEVIGLLPDQVAAFCRSGCYGVDRDEIFDLVLDSDIVCCAAGADCARFSSWYCRPIDSCGPLVGDSPD